MKNIWMPNDNVYWYTKPDSINYCKEDIQTDIAIIGGGMAGLSAAQAFNKKNKKVVLLEQYYCGAGASGKSSGFITPNAELSLSEFAHRYNQDIANQIWKFIMGGVQDIKNNIIENKFICDYAPQDSLELANNNNDLKKLKKEYDNLSKFGYDTKFYDSKDIKDLINTSAYAGGIVYGNTFGINSYLYCQELKKLLQKLGVTIYEETPVTSINENIINSLHAKIKAEYIIVCTDRFMPQLQLLKQEVYHAQTFLMISQKLTDNQIKTIFPNNIFMSWDMEFIYNYFRVTGEKRLLLGGGSILTTYSSKAQHDYSAITYKLTNYLKNKFPSLNIQFEYQWPGLIGISKDIGPIAGKDKDKSYIYYITAATGLPIAAALGKYSAESIIDGRNDLDPYFSPYRPFPIAGILQKILGTKISFALSNLIKKSG